MSQRWLIYALGGGMGHLTRAIALARVAEKHGHSVYILTNSPFANHIPWRCELGLRSTCRIIPATWGKDRVSEVVDQVLQKVNDFTAMIVDTFPRGLGGELASWLPKISIPKVLVHRDLNPRYVRQFQLRSFVAVYDHILLPGEPAAFEALPQSIQTAPWLIRDDNELLTREESRTRLKAGNTSAPVVAVLGCGKEQEIHRRAQLAVRIQHRLPHACVRFVSPLPLEPSGISTVCGWPLLEMLPGVDVMVGAGGYNTVQEARATKTPLLALPEKRLYDRQKHRLTQAEICDSDADLLRRLENLIAKRPQQTPIYTNGVHEAVQVLQQSW